jgi:hypothetical protein
MYPLLWAMNRPLVLIDNDDASPLQTLPDAFWL